MKTSITQLLHKSLFTGALLVFALAHTPEAPAQVFSVNCVGYVNRPFQPGMNLFGNPLYAGMNDLNQLFLTAPEGTTVSLWDAPTRQFLQTSLFTGGAWTMNLTLEPGTGALLTTPSLFVNSFVGEVPSGCDGLMLPPAFGGPDGTYLFSSKIPASLPTTVGNFDAFNLVIGRAPRMGESVTRLDAATQTYSTTTFDGTSWNNGVPGLGVSEAAFYNIGVVPEPSTLALGLCGGVLALLAARRRQRAKAVTDAKR